MPLKFNAIFKCLIACFCLSVMMACAKKESSNNELNSGLTDETGAHFVAGQIFSDRITKGLYGPELIVIAGNSFTQGAIKKDKQAQDNEKPAHQVEFNKLFSISRSEITVAQFREFVEITDYKTQADKNNSSNIFDLRSSKLVIKEGINWRHNHIGELATDNFPVVHVSFDDAMAYVQWLSKSTNKTYRLPSESEWEFALRANSKTIYPWGKKLQEVRGGNLSGTVDTMPNNRKWGNALPNYADGFWGLAPVRQYAAEGFGTFDMQGNVSEWVEDCWHDNYRRAPANGDAWVNPGCVQRVVRGSSWLSASDQSRSSFRTPAYSTTSNALIGFRVIRQL